MFFVVVALVCLQKVAVAMRSTEVAYYLISYHCQATLPCTDSFELELGCVQLRMFR